MLQRRPTSSHVASAGLQLHMAIRRRACTLLPGYPTQVLSPSCRPPATADAHQPRRTRQRRAADGVAAAAAAAEEEGEEEEQEKKEDNGEATDCACLAARPSCACPVPAEAACTACNLTLTASSRLARSQRTAAHHQSS